MARISRRVRILVPLTAVTALFVAVGTGVLLQDRIQEYWYCSKLSDSRLEERRAACAALMSRRAVRVIPRALEIKERAGEKKKQEICKEINNFLSQLVSAAGEEAIPPLVEALCHANAGVRLNALILFGDLGERASAASAALTHALGDPDPNVRCSAAGVVGDLGQAGRGAIPRLRDMLQDPSLGVRQAAGHALTSIETHPVSRSN